MSHIPKRAQRAIDAANKARAKVEVERVAKVAALPPIRFMALNVTPRPIINLHDVYFNGVKQHLCLIADVDNGMIRRWLYGKGNRPAEGSPYEDVFGKVEIKLKGK